MNPTVELKKRKHIWKYIQACRSLDEAITVGGIMLGIDDTGTKRIESHLWTALSVAYARPFTSNNGIGPIKKELVPTGKEPLHEMLIATRNKVTGHIDKEASFDNGGFLNTSSVTQIGGQFLSACSISRPSNDLIPKIIGLSSDLKDACEIEWKKILSMFIHPTDLKEQSLYRISLSETNDQLFEL